jgi:ankyrin repeat protein
MQGSPTSANAPISPRERFSQDESRELERRFREFDRDNSGSIDASELKDVLKELGESFDDSSVQELLAEVDSDRSGRIEFSEFVEVVSGLRSGRSGGFLRVYQKQEFFGLAEALRYAVRTGSVDRVNDLIKRGADPNSVTSYGNTALHLAAAEGHAEVVSMLLGLNKVKADAATNRGETPLHYAAMWGHVQVCKTLLEQPEAEQILLQEDLLGYTPADYAQYKGHAQLYDMLHKAATRLVGADVEAYRKRFRRESLAEEEES